MSLQMTQFRSFLWLSNMVLRGDLDGWDEGWEGGPRGRGYIYTHIADSRCCTAEANTTL